MSSHSKDQKSVEASALTAVAKFDGRSKVTTSVAEYIEYKCYRLKIEPHHTGWKVAIFPKGSPFALDRTPYTREVGGRGGGGERDKAIVDEVTADKSLHKIAIEPAEISRSWSLTLVAAIF